MLRFAFHPPCADVTQGMRAPVTSVPLRHRANHRSGVAGRRFSPICCHCVEVSVMTRDGVRLAVRDGGPRQAEHTVVFPAWVLPDGCVVVAPNRLPAAPLRRARSGDQL